MRDIKFRAWFKGEMISQPLNSTFGANRLFGFLDANGINEFDNVMQYTSLKDKNGVEIYEGDILRIPPETQWDEKNFSAFEVFFHDNDCTPTDVGLVFGRMKNYGSVAGGYCGYKLTPSTMEKFIVIGNIYKNPELLEGQK